VMLYAGCTVVLRVLLLTAPHAPCSAGHDALPSRQPYQLDKSLANCSSTTENGSAMVLIELKRLVRIGNKGERRGRWGWMLGEAAGHTRERALRQEISLGVGGKLLRRVVMRCNEVWHW
jgi:hypothetical protein